MSKLLTLTSTSNGNCNAVSDLVKINIVPKPFANFNFNTLTELIKTFWLTVMI